MLTFLSGTLTGLGLFLLGMKFLTEGLDKVISGPFKNIIRNVRIHPIVGMIIGLVVTGLLQSSSTTTVIIVSLVETNIINLYQATAMIMGANIGTTMTAQLLAFEPNKYIFIPFFISIIFSFCKKNKKLGFLGETLLGFSLIFIGIDVLGKGIVPLQNYIRFQEILWEFGKTPIIGILIGFCITAIIQSSSTGVAILQSLASSGLISLPAAVAILLGQNIGTCITPLISSIHLSVMGKRAAFIHLFFNIMGVLLIFPFIKILIDISCFLSPINPARQIANAHTLFNIFSTIAFLPFIPVLVKMSNLIRP